MGTVETGQPTSNLATAHARGGRDTRGSQVDEGGAQRGEGYTAVLCQTRPYGRAASAVEEVAGETATYADHYQDDYPFRNDKGHVAALFLDASQASVDDGPDLNLPIKCPGGLKYTSARLTSQPVRFAPTHGVRRPDLHRRPFTSPRRRHLHRVRISCRIAFHATACSVRRTTNLPCLRNRWATSIRGGNY